MRLKVICLNMWQGGILLDVALDFLLRERPDVLLLQEVYDGHDPGLEPRYRCLQVLQQRLGYPGVDFACTYIDDRQEGLIPKGNAIMSRYPIRQRHITYYDGKSCGIHSEADRGQWGRLPMNLQHVTLDISGVGVDIFNTQGIWGEDGWDNDRRLAMGRTIAEAVAQHPNVVLAGDFNVRTNTRTIAQIEQHLTNVFKDRLQTSFNMRRKDSPVFSEAVVDMMFVSSSIAVEASACPDVDVSDHLPLVAELELPVVLNRHTPDNRLVVRTRPRQDLVQ